MYLAAIDIGTNSVRLLVAAVQGQVLVPIRRELTTTKLGSGLSTSGRLSEQGKKATIQTMEDYLEIAHHHDVAKIIVFGTAALRQAEDGRAFAQEIALLLHQQVDIIPPSTEASLSYLGVTKSLPALGEALVFDLGGGSCELICHQDNEIKAASYELGALYLTERFMQHDPPLETETKAVRAYIRRHLKLPTSNKVVVGVGGTVSALAAMELKLAHYDADRLHGCILNSTMIEQQYTRMLLLSTAKRSLLPGMPPARALIMPAGTLVVLELLRAVGASQLTVSQGDILLGSLYAVISSTLI